MKAKVCPVLETCSAFSGTIIPLSVLFFLSSVNGFLLSRLMPAIYLEAATYLGQAG
jgi:hypothetical protein